MDNNTINSQADRIAKNDIEKIWGGVAYTRLVPFRLFSRDREGLSVQVGVQVALVNQRHYDWEVTTFHPWFTDTGKYVSSSGSGIGTGFATEADAVAVARAVINADWS